MYARGPCHLNRTQVNSVYCQASVGGGPEVKAKTQRVQRCYYRSHGYKDCGFHFIHYTIYTLQGIVNPCSCVCIQTNLLIPMFNHGWLVVCLFDCVGPSLKRLWECWLKTMHELCTFYTLILICIVLIWWMFSYKWLQLLEKFLRHVRTLCVAWCTARNSPVHSNGVINYAIAVRLFRTVLRDRPKNFSRYNSVNNVWFWKINEMLT